MFLQFSLHRKSNVSSFSRIFCNFPPFPNLQKVTFRSLSQTQVRRLKSNFFSPSTILCFAFKSSGKVTFLTSFKFNNIFMLLWLVLFSTVENFLVTSRAAFFKLFAISRMSLFRRRGIAKRAHVHYNCSCVGARPTQPRLPASPGRFGGSLPQRHQSEPPRASARREDEPLNPCGLQRIPISSDTAATPRGNSMRKKT